MFHPFITIFKVNSGVGQDLLKRASRLELHPKQSHQPRVEESQTQMPRTSAADQVDKAL